MARYQRDFMGIPADPRESRGDDPNYGRGYRGMRMRGGPVQAAYGRYRQLHADDLGTMGGFYGQFDRGEDPRLSGHRPGVEDGGLRDARYDRHLLHEYNSTSQRLRGEPRGRDSDEVRSLQKRARMPDAHGGERFGYSNRGYSSGGYSQGWAYGPMRGAPRSEPRRLR